MTHTPLRIKQLVAMLTYPDKDKAEAAEKELREVAYPLHANAYNINPVQVVNMARWGLTYRSLPFGIPNKV